MKSLLLALTLISPTLWSPAAYAEDWALGGFDPVEYQSDGRATPGRTDITTTWHGMVWHFATIENRATFEADPRAYSPGLNGLCPVALVDGRREAGDPEHFVVVGRRLYLLSSGADQQQFMADPRGILMEARKIWSSLK